MRRLRCLAISLPLLGLLMVPAFGQEGSEASKAPPKKKKEEFKAPPARPLPTPSFKHLDGQLLVFVANGAGGSTMASDNLIDVNGERHLGLRIQMVPWCRHDSFFMDLTDTEAQLAAAAKIADSVKVIRKDAPNAQIFLVGNSAGARVVLAAAEMLPARSVQRIILLAPAVSFQYDLTGALKASRYGIDNFWSGEDSVLECAEEHKGLADGLKCPAAGRIGFRPPSGDKKYVDAYRNLRQVRWNEDYCGSGGHFAWTLRHNLKKAIVPLFFTAPIVAAPTMEKKRMSAAD